MLKFQAFVFREVKSETRSLFLHSWKYGFLQVGCHLSSHVIPKPKNTPRLALDVRATNLAGMSGPMLKLRPTSSGFFFLGDQKSWNI